MNFLRILKKAVELLSDICLPRPATCFHFASFSQGWSAPSATKDDDDWGAFGMPQPKKQQPAAAVNDDPWAAAGNGGGGAQDYNQQASINTNNNASNANTNQVKG